MVFVLRVCQTVRHHVKCVCVKGPNKFLHLSLAAQHIDSRIWLEVILLVRLLRGLVKVLMVVNNDAPSIAFTRMRICVKMTTGFRMGWSLACWVIVLKSFILLIDEGNEDRLYGVKCSWVV